MNTRKTITTTTTNGAPTARTLRNRRKRAARAARRRAGGARAPATTTTVQVSAGPGRAQRRRQRRRGPASRINNPYLRCLLYPEIELGCKCPDFLTAPSGTFSVTYETALTTNAQGDAGFMFSPGGSSDYSIAATETTPGTWDNWTIATSPGITSANSSYEQIRLVSASITLEYIGNTQTDAGLVFGGEISNGDNISATVSSVSSLPWHERFPLRNGCRVTYRPVDNTDFEYFGVGVAGIIGSGRQTNGKPGLFVIVYKAAASTLVAWVKLHCNYEGIPKNDQFNLVQPAPSPSDPKQIAGATGDLFNLPFATALFGGAGLAQNLYSQALPLVTGAAAVAGRSILNAQRLASPIGPPVWGDGY